MHTACCASSELPLAFTVEPCNVNANLCFKPVAKKAEGHRHMLQNWLPMHITIQQRLGKRLIKSIVLNQSYPTENAPE